MESLAEPLVLLAVVQARERERDRRMPAEGRYPLTRTPFQIGGERSASLLRSAEERVGCRQEGVRRDVFWIGIERIDQRADGVLVTPEKNERVASTVEPSPPPRVARAHTVSFREPIESLFRLSSRSALPSRSPPPIS